MASDDKPRFQWSATEIVGIGIDNPERVRKTEDGKTVLMPTSELIRTSAERQQDFLDSLTDEGRKAVEDREKFGHFSDLIRTHLSPGFAPKCLPIRRVGRIVPETRKEGEE